MFKWAEISLKKNEPRYKFLSDFLNQNGFANTVEFVEIKIENFESEYQKAMAQFDGLKIGHGLGEIVFRYSPKQSEMVSLLKAADSLVKEQGIWWLRSFAIEGFSEVIKSHGEKFDFDSSVLIIGVGAAARIATTALYMSGFKNFTVSSLDMAQVENFVQAMKKNHFGINFKIVPKEEIILLPGIHGIMVNTTPLQADNPILEDLYYFNFFKSGGVAVDFTILPVETQLIKSAIDVGATGVYGYQIAGLTDIKWAERIMNKKLPVGDYVLKLGEHLKAQNLSV